MRFILFTIWGAVLGISIWGVYNIDQFFISDQKSIAWLTESEGVVRIRPSDLFLWQDAYKNQALFSNQILSTGKGSRAVIEFENGYRLSIGEFSQVEVHIPKKVEEGISVNILKGQVRSEGFSEKKDSGRKVVNINSGDKKIVLNKQQDKNNEAVFDVYKQVNQDTPTISVEKGQLSVLDKISQISQSVNETIKVKPDDLAFKPQAPKVAPLIVKPKIQIPKRLPRFDKDRYQFLLLSTSALLTLNFRVPAPGNPWVLDMISGGLAQRVAPNSSSLQFPSQLLQQKGRTVAGGFKVNLVLHVEGSRKLVDSAVIEFSAPDALFQEGFGVQLQQPTFAQKRDAIELDSSAKGLMHLRIFQKRAFLQLVPYFPAKVSLTANAGSNWQRVHFYYHHYKLVTMMVPQIESGMVRTLKQLLAATLVFAGEETAIIHLGSTPFADFKTRMSQSESPNVFMVEGDRLVMIRKDLLLSNSLLFETLKRDFAYAFIERTQLY